MKHFRYYSRKGVTRLLALLFLISLLYILLSACKQQNMEETSKEYYPGTMIETFTSIAGIELNIQESYPESNSVSYNYLMDNNAAGLSGIIKYGSYLTEIGLTKSEVLSTSDYNTYTCDKYIVITGTYYPQPNVLQYIVNITPITE